MANFFRRMRRGLNEGAPPVSPALRRAHQLFAAGQYSEAAAAFEELARRAEQRDGPRAPLFYIQAGRARILVGEIPLGMGHVKNGLSQLAGQGRFGQFYKAGQRISQELKSRGYLKESKEIAALLGANMPAIAELPTERQPDITRLTLPTNCPSCGGPLRPDELEWYDDRSAECSYCGNPVNAS